MTSRMLLLAHSKGAFAVADDMKSVPLFGSRSAQASKGSIGTSKKKCEMWKR